MANPEEPIGLNDDENKDGQPMDVDPEPDRGAEIVQIELSGEQQHDVERSIQSETHQLRSRSFAVPREMHSDLRNPAYLRDMHKHADEVLSEDRPVGQRANIPMGDVSEVTARDVADFNDFMMDPNSRQNEDHAFSGIQSFPDFVDRTHSAIQRDFEDRNIPDDGHLNVFASHAKNLYERINYAAQNYNDVFQTAFMKEDTHYKALMRAYMQYIREHKSYTAWDERAIDQNVIPGIPSIPDQPEGAEFPIMGAPAINAALEYGMNNLDDPSAISRHTLLRRLFSGPSLTRVAHVPASQEVSRAVRFEFASKYHDKFPEHFAHIPLDERDATNNNINTYLRALHDTHWSVREPQLADRPSSPFSLVDEPEFKAIEPNKAVQGNSNIVRQRRIPIGQALDFRFADEPESQPALPPIGLPLVSPASSRPGTPASISSARAVTPDISEMSESAQEEALVADLVPETTPDLAQIRAPAFRLPRHIAKQRAKPMSKLIREPMDVQRNANITDSIPVIQVPEQLRAKRLSELPDFGPNPFATEGDDLPERNPIAASRDVMLKFKNDIMETNRFRYMTKIELIYLTADIIQKISDYVDPTVQQKVEQAWKALRDQPEPSDSGEAAAYHERLLSFPAEILHKMQTGTLGVIPRKFTWDVFKQLAVDTSIETNIARHRVYKRHVTNANKLQKRLTRNTGELLALEKKHRQIKEQIPRGNATVKRMRDELKRAQDELAEFDRRVASGDIDGRKLRNQEQRIRMLSQIKRARTMAIAALNVSRKRTAEWQKVTFNRQQTEEQIANQRQLFNMMETFQDKLEQGHADFSFVPRFDPNIDSIKRRIEFPLTPLRKKLDDEGSVAETDVEMTPPPSVSSTPAPPPEMPPIQDQAQLANVGQVDMSEMPAPPGQHVEPADADIMDIIFPVDVGEFSADQQQQQVNEFEQFVDDWFSDVSHEVRSQVSQRSQASQRSLDESDRDETPPVISAEDRVQLLTPAVKPGKEEAGAHVLDAGGMQFGAAGAPSSVSGQLIDPNAERAAAASPLGDNVIRGVLDLSEGIPPRDHVARVQARIDDRQASARRRADAQENVQNLRQEGLDAHQRWLAEERKKAEKQVEIWRREMAEEQRREQPQSHSERMEAQDDAGLAQLSDVNRRLFDVAGPLWFNLNATADDASNPNVNDAIWVRDLFQPLYDAIRADTPAQRLLEISKKPIRALRRAAKQSPWLDAFLTAYNPFHIRVIHAAARATLRERGQIPEDDVFQAPAPLSKRQQKKRNAARAAREQQQREQERDEEKREEQSAQDRARQIEQAQLGHLAQEQARSNLAQIAELRRRKKRKASESSSDGSIPPEWFEGPPSGFGSSGPSSTPSSSSAPSSSSGPHISFSSSSAPSSSSSSSAYPNLFGPASSASSVPGIGIPVPPATGRLDIGPPPGGAQRYHDLRFQFPWLTPAQIWDVHNHQMGAPNIALPYLRMYDVWLQTGHRGNLPAGLNRALRRIHLQMTTRDRFIGGINTESPDIPLQNAFAEPGQRLIHGPMHVSNPVASQLGYAGPMRAYQNWHDPRQIDHIRRIVRHARHHKKLQDAYKRRMKRRKIAPQHHASHLRNLQDLNYALSHKDPTYKHPKHLRGGLRMWQRKSPSKLQPGIIDFHYSKKLRPAIDSLLKKGWEVFAHVGHGRIATRHSNNIMMGGHYVLMQKIKRKEGIRAIRNMHTKEDRSLLLSKITNKRLQDEIKSLWRDSDGKRISISIDLAEDIWVKIESYIHHYARPLGRHATRMQDDALGGAFTDGATYHYRSLGAGLSMDHIKDTVVHPYHRAVMDKALDYMNNAYTDYNRLVLRHGFGPLVRHHRDHINNIVDAVKSKTGNLVDHISGRKFNVGGSFWHNLGNAFYGDSIKEVGRKFKKHVSFAEPITSKAKEIASRHASSVKAAAKRLQQQTPLEVQQMLRGLEDRKRFNLGKPLFGEDGFSAGSKMKAFEGVARRTKDFAMTKGHEALDRAKKAMGGRLGDNVMRAATQGSHALATSVAKQAIQQAAVPNIDFERFGVPMNGVGTNYGGNIFDDIKGGLDTFGNDVKQGFNTAVNTVKDTANDFAHGVSKAAADAGFTSSNLNKTFSKQGLQSIGSDFAQNAKYMPAVALSALDEVDRTPVVHQLDQAMQWVVPEYGAARKGVNYARWLLGDKIPALPKRLQSNYGGGGFGGIGAMDFDRLAPHDVTGNIQKLISDTQKKGQDYFRVLHPDSWNVNPMPFPMDTEPRNTHVASKQVHKTMYDIFDNKQTNKGGSFGFNGTFSVDQPGNIAYAATWDDLGHTGAPRSLDKRPPEFLPSVQQPTFHQSGANFLDNALFNLSGSNRLLVYEDNFMYRTNKTIEDPSLKHDIHIAVDYGLGSTRFRDTGVWKEVNSKLPYQESAVAVKPFPSYPMEFDKRFSQPSAQDIQSMISMDGRRSWWKTKKTETVFESPTTSGGFRLTNGYTPETHLLKPALYPGQDPHKYTEQRDFFTIQLPAKPYYDGNVGGGFTSKGGSFADNIPGRTSDDKEWFEKSPHERRGEMKRIFEKRHEIPDKPALQFGPLSKDRIQALEERLLWQNQKPKRDVGKLGQERIAALEKELSTTKPNTTVEQIERVGKYSKTADVISEMLKRRNMNKEAHAQMDRRIRKNKLIPSRHPRIAFHAADKDRDQFFRRLVQAKYSSLLRSTAAM